MLEKIRTSVVNLDKYINNYYEQLPYLQAVGLTPERFSAVNAIDDEHKKHTEKLTFFFSSFHTKKHNRM